MTVKVAMDTVIQTGAVQCSIPDSTVVSKKGHCAGMEITENRLRGDFCENANQPSPPSTLNAIAELFFFLILYNPY